MKCPFIPPSPVPDPDLEKSGRGGGGGRSSSLLYKETGGGGAVSKKNFFGPLGPQFNLKIRGGAGPPGPSPGFATALSSTESSEP